MTVAVLFDNLGPYHWARLGASTSVVDLVAVQFGARSEEYAWAAAKQQCCKVVNVNSAGGSRELPAADFIHRLEGILNAAKPEVVVVPGWSGRGAYAAISWCVRANIPFVLMSESTEWDEPRVAWKEWIKRRIVGLASAALVGGHPHADYIQQLGMPKERIYLGYDVVDNSYFAAEADKWRRKAATDREQGLLDSEPLNSRLYFLSSNRFIEKKNLFRLLDAYATYVGTSQDRRNDMPPWDLCMLGDGELREKLLAHCEALGLKVAMCAPWELTTDERIPSSVYFPGFRQIDELPRFYANAGAFVHASTTEQWGLVVNEAMASRLPLIISNRVGCATDLVEEGVNGFTFAPYDIGQLADVFGRVSTSGFPLSAFGRASEERISAWGPDRFSRGLKAACETAMDVESKKAGLIGYLLLSLLVRK